MLELSSTWVFLSCRTLRPRDIGCTQGFFPFPRQRRRLRVFSSSFSKGERKNKRGTFMHPTSASLLVWCHTTRDYAKSGLFNSRLPPQLFRAHCSSKQDMMLVNPETDKGYTHARVSYLRSLPPNLNSSSPFRCDALSTSVFRASFLCLCHSICGCFKTPTIPTPHAHAHDN